MGRVIIVEGPDGAGKTRLCNQLSSDLGFKYLHEGPPPPEADRVDYYAGRLKRAVEGKVDVIFDRFHLGELVYGPVVRHEDRLGYDGLRLLQRACFAWGVVVAICLPPFSVCFDNWRAKPERDYLRQKYQWFVDVYYRFYALSAYHAFTLDYTAPNYQEVVARMNRTSLTQLRVRPPVVGSPVAKFLVLGERSNGELDLPFFSRTNSSAFLNSALAEAGFEEDELMFANAERRNGDDTDLREVKNVVPLKTVIALGGKALVCGRELGLDCHHLPHPSYWKRFKSRERAKYVARLAKIRSQYASN